MWHHVALNSCNPREQLKAYQNAIDVLQVISQFLFHAFLPFIFFPHTYLVYLQCGYFIPRPNFGRITLFVLTNFCIPFLILPLTLALLFPSSFPSPHPSLPLILLLIHLFILPLLFPSPFASPHPSLSLLALPLTFPSASFRSSLLASLSPFASLTFSLIYPSSFLSSSPCHHPFLPLTLPPPSPHPLLPITLPCAFFRVFFIQRALYSRRRRKATGRRLTFFLNLVNGYS